jgi:hypothetical protein
MDVQTTAPQSMVQKWRAHCAQHADRMQPINGTPTVRRRIERLEERLIAQLCDEDLSIAEQAVAFRCLMELRGATGRDVGVMFDVDPRVVVQGLSLLEMAAPAAKSGRAANPRRRTSFKAA